MLDEHYFLLYHPLAFYYFLEIRLFRLLSCLCPFAAISSEGQNPGARPQPLAEGWVLTHVGQSHYPFLGPVVREREPNSGVKVSVICTQGVLPDRIARLLFLKTQLPG